MEGNASTRLVLRVDPAVLVALDREAEREAAQHPGRKVCRTDIARELIYKAVAAFRTAAGGVR